MSSFFATFLTSYFTNKITGFNFLSNSQTLKQIGPQSSFPLFMIYHSFMISEQTKRKNLPHFQVKFRSLLLHYCDFRNHLLLGFYLKRAHILGFFIWQVLLCNDPSWNFVFIWWNNLSIRLTLSILEVSYKIMIKRMLFSYEQTRT